MAFKRPTKAQLQYWENRLQEYGLGMDSGRNTNKLSYGWNYEYNDDRNGAPLANVRVGDGAQVDGILIDEANGVYDTDEDF